MVACSLSINRNKHAKFYFDLHIRPNYIEGVTVIDLNNVVYIEANCYFVDKDLLILSKYM